MQGRFEKWLWRGNVWAFPPCITAELLVSDSEYVKSIPPPYVCVYVCQCLYMVLCTYVCMHALWMSSRITCSLVFEGLPLKLEMSQLDWLASLPYWVHRHMPPRLAFSWAKTELRFQWLVSKSPSQVNFLPKYKRSKAKQQPFGWFSLWISSCNSNKIRIVVNDYHS